MKQICVPGLGSSNVGGSGSSSGSGGGDGKVKDVTQNGTSVLDESTGIAAITTPTKTSELTNDSNFVKDDSYVHTDNNYDDAAVAEVAKVSRLETEVNNKVQFHSTYEETTDYPIGDLVVKDNNIYEILGYKLETTSTTPESYLPLPDLNGDGQIDANDCSAFVGIVQAHTFSEHGLKVNTWYRGDEALFNGRIVPVLRLVDASNKVDKVEGKVLSTNDYTDKDKAEVAKVDEISQELSDFDSITDGDVIQINSNVRQVEATKDEEIEAGNLPAYKVQFTASELGEWAVPASFTRDEESKKVISTNPDIKINLLAWDVNQDSGQSLLDGAQVWACSVRCKMYDNDTAASMTVLIKYDNTWYCSTTAESVTLPDGTVLENPTSWSELPWANDIVPEMSGLGTNQVLSLCYLGGVFTYDIHTGKGGEA